MKPKLIYCIIAAAISMSGIIVFSFCEKREPPQHKVVNLNWFRTPYSSLRLVQIHQDLSIEVKNISNPKVALCFDVVENIPSCNLIVRDKNNVIVPRLADGRRLFPAKNEVTYNFSTSRFWLKSGEVYKSIIPLSKYFDLNPGEYKISFKIFLSIFNEVPELIDTGFYDISEASDVRFVVSK